MHAFIIIGNNTQSEVSSRISTWNISKWDTISLPEDGSIGIDAVRDFVRELSMAPRNSPAKAGVILNMERLSPEAQNALLKTIEEPPPDTYIIGTTSNPEAILPTILSRMQVIRLTDSNLSSDTTLLNELMSVSVGKRMLMVDPYVGSLSDAKNFVTTLITAAERELRDHPSPKLTRLIRNLLVARTQLTVNVNPRLVVDNALM